MALQGCYACIKYLVIIFNFLFWLAGIAVLGLSVYSYIKGSSYASGSEDIKSFFTPLYILMAAGSLMTILGFLGCCGALRESQCMLGTFFFLVLVVLVAEITAGVWALMNKKEAKKVIADELTKIIQKQYGNSTVANNTIDAIQHDLQCCGAYKPEDWAESNFNKWRTDISVLDKISKKLGTYEVPESCCKNPETCVRMPLNGVLGDSVYSKGCIDAMEDFIKHNLKIVVGIGIGLGSIQILGLIFSIVLCCAIKNGEGMSYHV
uniref:Tetraspanin n=1 Tax=Centruroides hentzi TaxID=88313 RepID=A0A2I9LNU8_9SCOR